MRKFYFFVFLAACFTKGLFAQSNGVTSYTMPAMPANIVWRSSFAIDQLGHKWIGFKYAGAQSCKLAWYNDTVWRKFNYLFPQNAKINALAVDANNDLWVGADSGLYRLHDTVLAATYPVNDIISLACGNGNVYAGTHHGLIVYNGNAFNSYTTSNGLTSDTILSIAYESPSQIWLGEPGGLDKFDGSANFTFNYVYASQRDSVVCIYPDGSGNKWLGTINHGVIKCTNNGFYTMPQLYGNPLGVNWPTKTYSISKGPHGGVFFADEYIDQAPYNTPAPAARTGGSLELLNNSVLIYRSVAHSELTSSTSTSYPYYNYFQYDPVKGKVYFVPVNYPTINTILYSFDPAQYSTSIVTEKNSDYLDINNVKALISASADMHWDLQGSKYFVPKNSNSAPLKTSSVWLGGCKNGVIKTAISKYRQEGEDFWPGPLNITTDTTDVWTSAAYDKVWKVNRFDIANFIYNWNAGNVQNGSFVPVADIINWPANGGGQYKLAPFVDVNNDGYYDPLHAGDYPLIKGDQMIWWVFNDKVIHKQSGSASMGIQVNASAYAFVCPAIADSERVLNNTTFYNFEVLNLSTDRLDSFYMAPWMDVDLGNFKDDYVGCDISNNYGFVYNGDNYDEDMGQATGYHTNLPAFACNILRGPLADAGDGRDNNNNGIIDEANERCLMSVFTYTANMAYAGLPNPNAIGPQTYYRQMQGRWEDGSPITYGSQGKMWPGVTCRHVFPGLSDSYGVSMGGSISNPIPPPGNFGPTGWTQPQSTVVKNDLRFLIGVGPFTMQPGGTYELDYALVFTQDSVNCNANNLCVLNRAQQDNIRVKRWFDNNSFPSCLSMSGVGIKENAMPEVEVSVYPNPASDQLFVEFKAAQEKVTVELFDMTGRIVKGATYTDLRKYISVPVQELSQGVYMIRIKTGSGVQVRRFVKE